VLSHTGLAILRLKPDSATSAHSGKIVSADTFILMSGPTGIFTFSASGFAPPLLQKAEASKSGALNPEPLPCRDSDLS